MKKTKIKKAILLGVAICLTATLGFAQNIYTIAGDGILQGFSGDGGFAVGAKLHSPSNVAVDGSGNIYICDMTNNRIRKVTKSTGYISTVAGNGTAGFSGDGGAATSAKLFAPRGVAVDGSGNIYISDNGNVRIRKVTVSTGIINTVAGTGTPGYNGDGGAATSAQINNNMGICIDGSGNFYIADNLNYRIRKVTVSTGNISTVAGNGTSGFSGDGGAATSAKINSVIDVDVDGSGNLYIADGVNQRIRKVTASTGNISTVAGNGTAGFSGDGGAATSATMNSPCGVAVDGSGNIFIADNNNHRIRKVTASTGNISTVAGNGNVGDTGDGGAATSAAVDLPADVEVHNASGTFYIQYYYSRIRAVNDTCPANAGPDKIRTCGACCPVGPCPAVQIGSPSAGSGFTYSWATCNTTLSSCTVAQPNASPPSTTNYTLTVSGTGCTTKSDVVTVTVTTCCIDGRLESIIGSNADEAITGIKIFPNPSDGKIMIETAETIQSIIITDVTGRVVHKGNNIASTNYCADLSREPKGIYLVKIMQNGKEHIEKITIE